MWNSLKGKLYVMSGEVVAKSLILDVALVVSIVGVVYEVARFGRTA